MTRQGLLTELEALSHAGRVRRMVEVGRQPRGRDVAATLASLQAAIL